ncbi:hypothetical protein C4569_01850 [Candidatus Parcubacteria bacterium]|nr:MAG: hypothetical protein C4569_01850 [Candidatus Parcubacteria bacterium]
MIVNFLKNLFGIIHYNNKIDFFIYKKLRSYLPKNQYPRPPKSIAIDPCSVCNLSCPACVACKSTPGFVSAKLSFDKFKLMLDKMPFARKLLLCNWGEPFLNDDIFKMIRYAKTKKLYVSLYSNLNIKKNDCFYTELALSGLDDLLISIDGITQENYEKFRAGGNLSLVFENIKKINAAKEKKSSSLPKLYWHLTINKYNEKEITQAAAKAEELKMQFMPNYIILYHRVIPIDESEMAEKNSYWLPAKNKNYYHWQKNKPYRLDYPCQNLFLTVFFDPEGNCFPCRYLSDVKDSFGNILREDFFDIWYGKKFLSARSLFLKNKTLPVNKAATICDSCVMHKKY